MTSLESRVLAVLENGAPHSPWEELIALFRADRDAFYELACTNATDYADPRVRALADLAVRVRAAIQQSYEIEPTNSGANLVSFQGQETPIPADLVQRVAEFLRDVDGKTTATTSGRDYEGQEVSEAEVRFKLGDESTWAADHAVLESRRTAKPLVLRLSDEEFSHLSTQPAYVTYGLLDCARRVVLAPTSVFKGLNRGDDCPPDLAGGWAFCGKPRQARGNDGRPFAAPADMVYLVYADEQGLVFDWDWVKENPGEPGYPLDWRLRFNEPHQPERDTVLELRKDLYPGQFDRHKACYSTCGDCIFCYMTDEVSYADRINADLTIFKSLDTGQKITGFKVKNVQRILEVDQSIVISDAPGIEVSVESVLLASREVHPESSIDIYAVLIELRKTVGEPPKVRLPQPPAQLAGAE